MSQKKFTRDFINPQGRLIEVTEDTELTQFISVVEVDASAGPITITLPRAVGIGGKEIFVKKIDSGSNVVTMTTVLSETIDGETVQTLSNQNDVIHVVSDNENYQILSLGVGGALAELAKQFSYSPEINGLTGTQVFDAGFQGQGIGEGTRPGTGQILAGSVKTIRARRFTAASGTNTVKIRINGVAQTPGLVIPDGGTQAVFTDTTEYAFSADDIIEIEVIGTSLSCRIIIEFEYP